MTRDFSSPYWEIPPTQTPDGLLETIVQLVPKMMESRILVEYGPRNSVVFATEPCYDPQFNLSWSDIISILNAEERMVMDSDFASIWGITTVYRIHPPFNRALRDAAYKLDMDKDRFKEEIQLYVARRKQKGQHISQLSEECRWDELAQSVASDWALLPKIFLDRPDQRDVAARAIKAVKREWFAKIWKYNRSRKIEFTLSKKGEAKEAEYIANDRLSETPCPAKGTWSFPQGCYTPIDDNMTFEAWKEKRKDVTRGAKRDADDELSKLPSTPAKRTRIGGREPCTPVASEEREQVDSLRTETGK